MLTGDLPTDDTGVKEFQADYRWLLSRLLTQKVGPRWREDFTKASVVLRVAGGRTK